MEKLTPAQRALFEEPNFAHLATHGEDGYPSVSPVWVDLDGDLIVVNTAEGRRKTDNMRRDARVGISVHRQTNPYDHVSVQGDVVEITPEGADAHIDAMAKKYLGQDTYPFRAPGEVRVMVKIRPDGISAMLSE